MPPDALAVCSRSSPGRRSCAPPTGRPGCTLRARRLPSTCGGPSCPSRYHQVFTDGACRGNPGPGGWAWAVPNGPQDSGHDPATTNQRMEVRAAYEAIRALPGTLVVVSDSTYVVNCFKNSWWTGWRVATG